MILNKKENNEIEMKLEDDDYEETEHKIDIDEIYNNVITMDDLYFNQINRYMYLVDFNRQNVYDFSDVHINILQYLRDELLKGETITLYPVDKKTAEDLLQDLENGY